MDSGRFRRPGGRRLAAWLVFAALVGPGGGAGAQNPDDRRAVVSGRVVDALTGRPVEGALVEAAAWPNASYRNRRAVRTDRDGRFLIDGLTPGRARLRASHPAYLDGGAGQQRPHGKVPSVELTETSITHLPITHPPSPITIALGPPAIVSGRVTDSTGAPLAGVTVQAVPDRWHDPSNFSAWTQRAETNDLGEYEFSSLPPGPYHIVVYASHLTWAVNSRTPQVVFPYAPSDASAVTSEDGRFSWSPGIRAAPPAVADGREAVFLTTGHPGVTDPEAFARLALDAGDERANVDIVMQAAPRVRVRGVAVGPNGPLSHVFIRLRQPGQATEEGVQAVGHADGTFEFLSVPPGVYELDAFRMLGDSHQMEPDPDGYWARMSLTVGGQSVDDLTVQMTRGVSMRARLEFRDQPAARGGSISLIPVIGRAFGNPGGTQRWSAQTFEVLALTPGDYLWSVGARDNWGVESITRAGRDVTGEPLHVGTSQIDDVVITITGKPASIRGRVSPPPDTPVELLSVVLFPIEPEKRGGAFSRQTLVRIISLPPDGTYAFESLPPGRYVVAAIDEATRDDWPAPDLLDRIAATSGPVTLSASQALVHELVVR